MFSLKNIYFLSFIFLCSCLDRFEIPENIQDSDSEMFGAGDTTYLLIKPTWNSNQGIVKPVEISIAQDGRIFVADESQFSILVFDQSGNQPEGVGDSSLRGSAAAARDITSEQGSEVDALGFEGTALFALSNTDSPDSGCCSGSE